MVFEELRGVADRVLRRNGAVGPHFEGELVVIGHLAETRGLDGEVDLAHRRVHRVDRDVAERQVLVEVLVGADVAAAALQPHLDREPAAFADGGDVHVAVEHFDVGVGLDLAAAHIARLIHGEADGFDSLAHDLEGNLFQVEDDIGGVFDHARNRAEFVLDAFDAHRRDGRAFDRAQQHAPQAVADGGAEAALKRLRREHAIPFRKGLGIGNQSFGFLEAFKHKTSSIRTRAAPRQSG